MNELIWVTAAEYLGGHKLGLSFNDGSRKVFDFSPLIKKFPLYKGIEPTEKFKDFTVTCILGKWRDRHCSGISLRERSASIGNQSDFY